MKHFVYLDTDMINSYLSQVNGGLLKNIINEVSDEVATGKSEGISPNSKSSKTTLGFAPLFQIGLTENGEVTSTTNTLTQTESGRELVEKILHDNAFEMLVKNLHEGNDIKDLMEIKIGNYAEIENNFIIRDLEYIVKIYNDEFIEFLAEQDKEVQRLVNKEVNTAQKSVYKNHQNEIKKASDRIIAQHKKTQRIFNVANNIITFSKFIICEDCIVPLNDKYLRESTEEIRFKYSQKIKVLGKYTSTLKEAVSREESYKIGFGDMFSAIDEVYKEFYINILGLKDSMKIIHPIALYFE